MDLPPLRLFLSLPSSFLLLRLSSLTALFLALSSSLLAILSVSSRSFCLSSTSALRSNFFFARSSLSKAWPDDYSLSWGCRCRERGNEGRERVW